MAEMEIGSSTRNRTPASERNLISPASSLSLKSVLLHDWWLVKNHNKQISVAGRASTQRLGVRVFISAPISRRICTTTLETIDGIIVTISGFINRSKMLENGFPFLVCNNFDLGFPYDWEDCISQYNDEESAKRCVSTEKSSNSSFSSILSLFDNLPSTKVRDLVLHLSACSDSSCDHVTEKVASNDSQHSEEVAKFEADETTRHRKRAKADQVYNTKTNTNNNDDAKNTETEVVNQGRGVTTRSRQSSMEFGCKEENVSLKSSGKSKKLRSKPGKDISGGFDAQLSTREANTDISAKLVSALKVSSGEDTELTEATDLSSVRRSERRKIQRSYFGMS